MTIYYLVDCINYHTKYQLSSSCKSSPWCHFLASISFPSLNKNTEVRCSRARPSFVYLSPDSKQISSRDYVPALSVLTGEAGCVVKGDLSALLRYPAALFPGKSGFHIRGEVEERGGLDRAETGPSLPRKIFFFFFA